MNADESKKKNRPGILDIFSKVGLFKTLLFWFLIIALVPVIADWYIHYRHLSIYLHVILLFFIILLAFIAAKRITAPIEVLSKGAKRVASGKFDQLIKIDTKNEIGTLASIFNDMILKFKNATEESEYQGWLRDGRSTLIDRMRREQDVPGLCSKIISFISEYINAQVGLMYMNEDGLFRLSGSYAYARNNKNHSTEFKLGEGLVGQAALKKTIIVLNDVPGDQITVSSGLGEMAPRSIIVLPVLFDDGTVVSIIELGTIHEFSDQIKYFLNHISKNIAIALHTVQSRQKMNELLEKTLSQAAVLQKQQTELKRANEDLEAQTKAHKEYEEKLKLQQEELKKTNEELEEKTRVLEKQKEDMKMKNQALEEAGKLLEEKAKEIEIASQYKSQFLANMSHELRTPLNSIILLSQLLSENKEKNLTEKQVEYTKSVQSSGYDLLKLINEILDLSKVESGKIELNVEEAAIVDITNAIERNFKPLVEEKDVSFTISVDGNLPKFIYSDRQRIEQVLKNLLSNAFKFTSRGGIGLRIGRPDRNADLTCSGLNLNQCISFAVSDTGIGIPEEKLNLIFEAFQQADGTTSRKYGGTGLGLSISKELACILGGEIQAVSTAGRGSTFTLYLPETLAPVKDIDGSITDISVKNGSLLEAGTGEKNNKAGEPEDIIPDDRDEITISDNSILVIDDDNNFVKTLRDLLREKGFKTVIANNGETGLQFTEIYKPSAIILDINLPGMNGWTVMSRLKDNNETRHIPVYFISASDTSGEAMKLGAADCILKPVSAESLEKLLIDIEQAILKTDKALLVIEDNPVTKKIIEKLFDDTGVGIVYVSTGKEAIERLTNDDSFDCVILDLSLPDMSGFEILSKIKENGSWYSSPIVVYTGKKLSAHERAILNEYTERIIVKGVNSPAKLLDEVSLHLHLEVSKLPAEKRQMLSLIHDRESIFKDKKILITDDDMRNVFLVTNLLEQKGMKVIVAKTGRDALNSLRDNHGIDLIIMDIMMPEMDGYTAIREIRKQKSYANIPIIALTAKAMKGDRAKCLEAGASDYISKPFEKERLFSVLRAWLY